LPPGGLGHLLAGAAAPCRSDGDLRALFDAEASSGSIEMRYTCRVHAASLA
jgi:hypothetical protein